MSNKNERTMRHFSSVRTERFSPAKRLVEWQDTISVYVGKTPENIRRLERTSISPLYNEPFNGQLEYGSLGDLQFCRMVCSPHHFSRRINKVVYRDGYAGLLVLQMGGVSQVEQSGQSSSFAPGDLFFLDCSKSFTVISTKHCEYLMILFENLATSFSMPKDIRINNRKGLGRMLHNLIVDAYSQYPLLNEVASSYLGKSIFFLLQNTVENKTKEDEIEYNPRLLKKNWIKDFVDKNLSSHELSVDRIAQIAKCSTRTLHRTFEDDSECSLSEYIWQRRLSRCAEDLRNPDSIGLKISEISCKWGFTCSAHFSRAFKASYGVSPRVFRDSVAKNY
ncbi:MAG: helix-turn-helix domain-containing protein [Halomonas sp.]|nr:helix-turn-helix domain-containing protein [Halomonas sp.]